MSLLVFDYCICAFLCCCHSSSLSLCHLSLFLLSYVAVSLPCCLSEFFPNSASVSSIFSLFSSSSAGERIIIILSPAHCFH